MADRCRVCLRPNAAPAEFDPQLHCPRIEGWPLGASAENVIACVSLGVVVRDAQLAATKAQLDRARLMLIKARDGLDLAIAETAVSPGDGEQEGGVGV